MKLKIKNIIAERLNADVNTLNGEENILYLVSDLPPGKPGGF